MTTLHAQTRACNRGETNSTKKTKLTKHQLSVLVGDAEPRKITVTGRRTLAALISSGSAVITALELSSWALRLAHYIFVLRSEYDLTIITHDEKHNEGSHGRYVLVTPVTLAPAEAQ